ncbi:phosphate ABC transporter permease [Cyanobacterium stanieri LEGE 03274]|uniref:Phosphate ABC transporter permease n=1 Tax=Cyanobacterium stanieri LEGE 03274 TaxID=1828756 RepID=A0ABR9V0N1_9CHRO|nr:phosphate ABC transporter permease [Cyanobacterium stanieri]MBE9221444.1 phosphate ABC transporter permease [Cyanobacterium stanieri LEGE 03274]
MLIPLRKEALDDMIPAIATGTQYAYYWANFSTLLKNLFISLLGVLIFWLLGAIFGEATEGISLILTVTAGLYWLWSPVYWASVRNGKYRRYNYVGFWRGRVLDVYITEEVVNEASALDKLGKVIIVENLQKKINVEVGDKSGFRATITSPLQRIHKVINRGQAVEGLLLSNDPDFMRISKVTDIYIPRHKLWVGEYPYIRRDIFLDVRKELAKIYG